MSEAIRFKHVYFNYDEELTADKTYTISDVSFCVEKGEYVTLIGHNGSGKSTIAKIIAGILETRETDNKEDGVYINEQLMTEENYQELQKRVGMVFQNPDNQFIGSTVQDDIAFGLENLNIPYPEMRKLVDKYAAEVGMKDYLDREPTALSGGQKQRVAIAGTLVRQPDILVLDEATSMLDPRGRRDIRELIKLMKNENPNLTIFSITHDIEEAYQADRVIVLNKGRVVKEGKPDAVFNDEETLKKINLNIPFFKQLKSELKKYDIDIENINNISGLVNKLCR